MPVSDASVSLIGLGRMGLPMIQRLQGAGHTVLGFDADPGAIERAGAAGIPTAQSLGEAFERSGIVILMLPNSDIVEAVLADPGVVATLRPGLQVVDMSSSEPERTRRLGAALAERGVELFDAPVSGGVSGAQQGTLTVMVGGDPAGIAELTRLLEAFGRVMPVGPLGGGHALKALNNLLSATHLWITSEAMYVAEDLGIDPDVALQVFNTSSGRSGSSERKWPDFIRTGRYDSGFALALMLKDVGIAAELMTALGRPSAVAAAVRDGWGAASQQLGPAADHTEVARYLEGSGGVRPA